MRLMNAWVLNLLFVSVMFFSGCATTQERLLDSDSSQVQLRSIQTRTFDTTDRANTLRTIMATLQDLDFVIDQADSVLGTVTATKLNRYALRLTASVRAKGEEQILVRVNCQYENKPVYDPEPYQKFFASLSKAMFLSANYETPAKETNKKPTKSGTKENVTNQGSAKKESSSVITPSSQKTGPFNTIPEFKQGDVVLVEFKDGTTKDVTITNINDRFLVGTWSYDHYRPSSSWDRRSIKRISLVK